MILAEGVRFAYTDRPVLDGVDLLARPGRLLGLIGPNGSGKSTLLRGLHAALPLRGRLELDGTAPAALGPREVARRVAVVVQEHPGDLPLTVAELVMLGRLPHRGAFGRSSAGDEAACADALRRVGALDLAGRRYAELSGGERQRVLVARALAQQAGHLLLDEPTNHLDVRYQHEVLALVRGLALDGTTVVVVLHDLNLAAGYCDDLVLLDAGRIAAAGTVDEVLRPEVLQPVYRLRVRRLDVDGGIHLAFRPA